MLTKSGLHSILLTSIINWERNINKNTEIETSKVFPYLDQLGDAVKMIVESDTHMNLTKKIKSEYTENKMRQILKETHSFEGLELIILISASISSFMESHLNMNPDHCHKLGHLIGSFILSDMEDIKGIIGERKATNEEYEQITKSFLRLIN